MTQRHEERHKGTKAQRQTGFLVKPGPFLVIPPHRVLSFCYSTGSFPFVITASPCVVIPAKLVPAKLVPAKLVPAKAGSREQGAGIQGAFAINSIPDCAGTTFWIPWIPGLGQE